VGCINGNFSATLTRLLFTGYIRNPTRYFNEELFIYERIVKNSSLGP